MLSGLSAKLRESLEKLARGNADKEAVEEMLRDMQRSLISADVDVRLVFDLTEKMRKRCFESLPPGMTRKEHIIKVVYEELTEIMGKTKPEISLKRKKILLIGLYASGKTSTAAKLARFYKKKGLTTALVACDTVRPAAYEQLQQLAVKIEVPFYGEKGERNSNKILVNGMKKLNEDVIIIDSSGRNALDSGLIDEIKGLNETAKKFIKEGEALEKILVIPADIGQAAKPQVSAFHDALGITDIIVTRLDATAKGGGALTACYMTGAKVKFITAGETPDDIEMYNPEKFVSRLIGFPDLETLLEKARVSIDEKKAEKVIKGDFDIEDFYSQIEGVRGMGSLSQIMDMMGMGKMAGKVPNLEVQEEKMKRWKYAIQGMTKEEKADPEIINPSRIRRIAKGSGCSESDVRELLNSYSKSKKMMKKISPSMLKRGGMASLFRQFGMR
ncbi:MAG: signal recognition particle receptor subunit alpha [Candidatus Aenigmarchaeota archaeon]|nr:signal recognition particle receptor subunit alpha [Candidatus Aenigmarchaeota archaeon]MDI6722728.1 signal recognition particle receptor subunit alpha [Candidatus Aenigmarchaeota archaeon]